MIHPMLLKPLQYLCMFSLYFWQFPVLVNTASSQEILEKRCGPVKATIYFLDNLNVKNQAKNDQNLHSESQIRPIFAPL